MIFKVDKQTIDDLGIFGKIRENSVYGIFNKTITAGGGKILEEMFMYPLSDEDKINEREMIFRYFQNNEIVFPFKSELFDSVEFYLSNTDNRTRLSAYQDNLERKFKNAIGSDTEYKLLAKGVLSMLEILNILDKFIRGLENQSVEEIYRPQIDAMKQLLGTAGLEACFKETDFKKLPYAKVSQYDQIFRFGMRDKMKEILRYIYCIDVFASVAKVSKERKFAFAKALPSGTNFLLMENVYHPLLKKPVANSIRVDHTNNMIFLTGANMAGKSTFMKTFGIAVFLAHMGFPVPAEKMEFSVQSGMFTTINLPDNMNMGYSHFYAEVMRVKKVAENVGKQKNLIVIFDELFRGTNVKDAYDATVAVTEAFAANRNCTFIISTHIIEAGETLKERCDNINFINLPTVMEGSIPKYTYKVVPGITEDRHGMIIIRNEGILDILSKYKSTGGQL